MKNSCCMCFFTEVLPYQEAVNFARLIKRGGVCSTQVRAIRLQPSVWIIALIQLSFGAIFQDKAPFVAGFGPARVIFSHLLTNQLFRICCWCLWKRRRTGVEPASRGGGKAPTQPLSYRRHIKAQVLRIYSPIELLVAPFWLNVNRVQFPLRSHISRGTASLIRTRHFQDLNL